MVSCALTRVCSFLAAALLASASSDAQTPESGRRQYDTLCSRCHGGDGRGGELGPAISTRLGSHTNRELAALIRQGLPGKGMPGVAVPDAAMRRLLAFVRTLRSSEPDAPASITVKTTDGQVLEGHALNQTSHDLQLAAGDTRVHLLRRDGERYRPVTSQADWPTYNGQFAGSRHSALSQITTGNVARLAPKWTFTLPN